MKKSNMYSLSRAQYSPFVGCEFDCSYCENSFQLQLKRYGKKHCKQCYDFTPHYHPERLDQPLPKTGYLQFIFCCPFGDISFCSTEYLEKIVNRIRQEKDKTFLIQSKNPKTFGRIEWPDNVILGTTIETNCQGIYDFNNISKAPEPAQRIMDFEKIKHPNKMLTFEPVLDFDVFIMKAYVNQIKPLIVWLGFDSKKNNLPEPPIEKVKELYWELGKLGIPVILKRIRDDKSITKKNL